MSLTFYFAPMSTAATVHWSLEELGIPYEAVKVDLTDAADKQRKLGPVNPNLRVPTIVHDGTVVFESAAIQAYLGETFGVEKGLYPAPGRERGNALKWLVWTNVTLAGAVYRWQSNEGDRADAARKEVDALIGLLEKEFADKSYILGPNASLVDFHLGSFFQWMGFLGVSLDSFPNTKAWLARCSARPANLKLAGG